MVQAVLLAEHKEDSKEGYIMMEKGNYPKAHEGCFTMGDGATEYMLSCGNEHPMWDWKHVPDTEGCALDGTLKDNFGVCVAVAVTP